MSPGLKFMAFIVLLQLIPSGLGGHGTYIRHIKHEKVTAQEMEAEMEAKFSAASLIPGAMIPMMSALIDKIQSDMPDTTFAATPESDSDLPDLTLAKTPNELRDMDMAFFPSPDDDGNYVRVVMSEDAPMEFHSTNNQKLPITISMNFAMMPMRPKSVLSDDVKFFLFTKKTANAIRLYNNKDNGPTVEGFWIKGGKVKILCHGFQSSYLKPFPQLMKDSYMKMDEDLNVILVDWSKLASSVFYFTVAKQTTGVGQQVSTLVQSLMKEGLTTLDQVHFIGHSLGAHVGGAFGFNLQDTKVGTVSRITGLDPAGPGFCDDNLGHLQTSDAHFVDVIHTDDSSYCEGKIAWLRNRAKGKWGSDSTSGHSNFFPNGGQLQPGCGTGVSDTCSHSRAYYLMEESFNSTTGQTIFKGCPCDSYEGYLEGDCTCSSENSIIMGEYTPVVKDGGKYFFKTGPQYPYSQVI